MALCYCYVPYILLCMYISSLFTTCPTICCHGPLQSPFVAIGGSVSSADCAIVISHLNTDASQGVYEQQLVSGIMMGKQQHNIGILYMCIISLCLYIQFSHHTYCRCLSTCLHAMARMKALDQCLQASRSGHYVNQGGDPQKSCQISPEITSRIPNISHLRSNFVDVFFKFGKQCHLTSSTSPNQHPTGRGRCGKPPGRESWFFKKKNSPRIQWIWESFHFKSDVWCFRHFY